MSEGLLLVGHGTRDETGRREFLVSAGQVQSLWPQTHVAPCFLELAAPSIAQGMDSAYRAGVRRLTVMPLLLFAAGHAKRDIPDAVEAAATNFPDLSVCCLQTSLECHPALLWLSELRFRQALAGRGAVANQDTALVMIGRGSSDEDATQRMHQFAELRRRRTPVGQLHVGFIAMQRPTVDEALRAALASGVRRIVVQPHLLFSGELLNQVQQAAADVNCHPPQELMVAPHLAPGWPLARGVIQLGCGAGFPPAARAVTAYDTSSWKNGEPSGLGVRNG